MAALTDLSDIINRTTGGNSGAPETIFFFKDSRTFAGAAVAATVSGRLTSLWQYIGSPTADSSNPSSGVASLSTNGAMQITNPAGGTQKWLLGMTGSSSVAGTLILYDRLAHNSGLSGILDTAQTVNLTPDRYTSTESAGNQIWLEIYSLIGTTARTVTISYTNQNGTDSRTTPATAIGGTGLREAQRLIQIPLAAGDTGVRSVESVTLSGSTGTAGNFGVVIGRPLIVMPLGVIGTGSVRDLIAGLPGIIEIKTDACLSLQWLANVTAAPQIYGSLHMVEK